MSNLKLPSLRSLQQSTILSEKFFLICVQISHVSLFSVMCVNNEDWLLFHHAKLPRLLTSASFVNRQSLSVLLSISFSSPLTLSQVLHLSTSLYTFLQLLHLSSSGFFFSHQLSLPLELCQILLFSRVLAMQGATYQITSYVS